MPMRRQPETLYNFTLAITVDKCLEEWSSNACCRNSDNIEKYLLLPPSIQDSLVNKLIDKFSLKFRELEMAMLCELLNFFLTSRLSVLNLKCLNNHRNPMYTEDLATFEESLLGSLPYMNNLTFISFMGCGKRNHSLPICTDRMMEIIGSSCPCLKSLDISNTDVSDTGISYLIPSMNNPGCPFLVKLFLFECYATVEGVSNILLNLPNLNSIGFKETGIAISKLYKDKCKVELNLKHINNIGCSSSSCWDMTRLLYRPDLSRIIRRSAPYVEGLKVRVQDHHLHTMELGPKVTSIYLLFSLENVSNPGDGFINLLASFGHQLTSLTLYCHVVKYSQVMQIGEMCRNLLVLDLRCNQISNDCSSGSTSSKLVNIFFNLERLSLNVRHLCPGSEEDNSSDPVLECLSAILNSSKVLEGFYLAYYSDLITDLWLAQILNLFNPDTLRSFLVELPQNSTFFLTPSALDLTRVSAAAVISKFPNLNTLGKLSQWSLSRSEYLEMCRQNDAHNFDLNIRL